MFVRLRMAAAVLVLLLPIAFLGCSDDATTLPNGNDAALTGLAQGEFDESLGSFEFRTNAGPDPMRPLPGPFLLKGQNLAWVDSVTALRADILVENISGNTYSEPVTLTFTRLWPDSVKVTDSEYVELELITFSFENEDGTWTDGESSLPETIFFDNIEQGQSIGFTARVDVAMMPGMGSIGGVVFSDEDQDGMRGDDEMGIAGAMVSLGHEGMDPMQTMTAQDGSYRFDGLEAGFYSVLKMPADNMQPTTPTEIQVILQEDGEGGISSFLEADFGCFVTDDGSMPPLVEVGDCVEAVGMLAEDPYRLLAFGIECEGYGDYHGDDDKDGDHGGDHDWEDDDENDDCSFGELRGPVTDIDREGNRIAVMGTWLQLGEEPVVDPMKGGDGEDDDHWHPCEALSLDDVEVGDRVRVRTTSASDPGDEEMIQGYRLRCWNGRWDKIQGIVDAVETDEEGRVTSFTILRTTVVPMRKDGMDR